VLVLLLVAHILTHFDGTGAIFSLRMSDICLFLSSLSSDTVALNGVLTFVTRYTHDVSGLNTFVVKRDNTGSPHTVVRVSLT